ncbi:MAG: DUF3240 family protein [Burkholderiales bacterium]|nr:DUF3240 family protein [Burkholderiales bacterium]
MKTPDCCLTLSFPHALEEHIVDHLLDHPEWVDGFSTVQIEGHGRMHEESTAAELVRGRAGRRYAQLVLEHDDARVLLDQLRADLPSDEIAYWITPVLEFGRFA